MDSTFDITLYRPTRPPEPGGLEKTAEELITLFTQLRNHTKSIIKHPYDPYNWTQRANTLAYLRYPELAVGDAYKAASLCRAHMQMIDETKNTAWRLGYRMGFWMRDAIPIHDFEGSYSADGHRDQLQQRLSKLQGLSNKIEKRNLYFYPIFEEGRFRRRMYPWMLDRHKRRSDELVERLNEEFEANRSNILVDFKDCVPFCAVKRDAFDQGEDGVDVLGVTAARDIKAQQVILDDKTRAWGMSKYHPRGDVEKLRRERFDEHGQQLIDGNEAIRLDLDWIREDVDIAAGPVFLSCRLLLAAINDDAQHPLDHHLIARLTPTYREDHVDRFVLANDIAVPSKALQAFGIDIFANQNYDTWVLFTIQERTLNNSCGDQAAESLNPLFALFNHSCDPNVEWTAASDHRTILVRAKRDIKKGEQLLVEYDQFMRDQPLEVRRKRMYRWLDGPCRCTRCVAEEAESKHEVKYKNEWDDIPEKVVFPEDLLKMN